MRSNLQKGLCPTCSGFLQRDDIGEIVYCINCDFKIYSVEFDNRLEQAYTDDFKIPDIDENLKRLNNL